MIMCYQAGLCALSVSLSGTGRYFPDGKAIDPEGHSLGEQRFGMLYELDQENTMK